MIAGRTTFTQFLTKCYSSEVLEFWDMSTEYIQKCRKKSITESAKELACKMVAEYVLPNAPQKLDLGESIELPLIHSYEHNDFSPGSFDEARALLLKLLQGLRMDASVTYGVTSPATLSIEDFLEDEERKMHQLRFKRDVHPLLHKLRTSQTYGSVSDVEEKF